MQIFEIQFKIYYFVKFYYLKPAPTKITALSL